VYTLEPVRVIVKDQSESVTYIDDILNLNRHDAVFITSPGINSGAETTLENVLAAATTALGAGFQYKESSGATARNYVDWLGEDHVSVKDFGAVGDGTTDDTVAIQAASDRIKARAGGWVYFPVGTYKITSGLTVDTVGVCWRGAGRKSILKNFSTSASTLAINVGSAIDSKIIVRDLAITANTTSSGAAVTVTNGNRIKVEGVAVALHRSGIITSAVTEAQVRDCTVESTDDNAAAIGVSVGTRGRIDNCNVISATTNGTGLSLGADARAVDSYVEKFATAVSMTGAGAQTRGVLSSVATTAFSLGAANTIAEACFASGASTAYTVGAFAGCGVPFCRSSTSTTDLTVNASATLFDDRGTSFTGTVTNSATSPAVMPLRPFFSSTSTASSSPTFTPDISGGKNINILVCTDNLANPLPLTIAAHATATLAKGDIMVLVLMKLNSNAINLTWNAQYKDPDGSTSFSGSSTFVVSSNNWRCVAFQWNGTNFVAIWATPSTVN